MNVFFVFDDNTLVTPPLGGTILPWVTRDSILTLAADAGLKVEERPYTFEEWQADAKSGRLKEAFACGTAAVLAAIGEIRHAGGAFKIGDGSEGPTTTKLRDQLTGIQRCTAPDPYGWVHKIDMDG